MKENASCVTCKSKMKSAAELEMKVGEEEDEWLLCVCIRKILKPKP